MKGSSVGTLYLVPTPIGNLADITLRALETLRKVELIAAEDTRTSLKLLRHYDISPPRLMSYHKFSEQTKTAEMLDFIRQGGNLALISDAGSPGISDPAEILVKAAIEEGIRVEALPGATAFVPALTASGLSAKSFTFIGFLPSKPSQRSAVLKSLSSLQHSLIFYEAPHRIRKFLAEILESLGDRNLVLAREISKIYEEYRRGTCSQLLADEEMVIKGEFVVIVEGAAEAELDEDGLESEVRDLLKSGMKGAMIMEALADYPRNKVYACILAAKKGQGK